VTLTLVAAAEAAPLWNPLSITTLVLAAFGTLGTLALGIYTAVSSHRRDHPKVAWEFDWTGPYREPGTDAEVVAVWVSNRGNGVAHDVEAAVGMDGEIKSGDSCGDVPFSDGFRFEFVRPTKPSPEDYFRHVFKTSVMIRLRWSQQPNMHRRVEKVFELPIRDGQSQHVASRPLPRRILNDRGIY